jgi:HlyD family secretion protein
MDNGKQPYFKVRCSLDQHELSLKNGYVGKIRKGMTLQARFFVTRRTLFQLLYDKADDWLNPNVTTNQTVN